MHKRLITCSFTVRCLSPIAWVKVSYIFLVAFIFLGCSQDKNKKTADQSGESAQNSTIKPLDETSGDAAIPAPYASIQFTGDFAYNSTEEVIIGSVGSVVVDEDDRLFITDSSQNMIHVFQSDGEYVSSFGRHGRGPGEFLAITPHTNPAIHTGRFFITDLADMHLYFPYRMHEFLLNDFSFVRTINLLAENKSEFDKLEGYYPTQVVPLKDGTFLIAYQRSPNEYLTAASSIHFVIQDSSANITNSSVLTQKDKTNLITDVLNFVLPYQAIHSFPFHGKSLLEISEKENNLYAIHHSEEFRIDVYTFQGDPIDEIKYDYENVVFNKNEAIDFFEKTEYGQNLGEGVAIKMIEEADNLPETWPAINDLLIDNENRLWVSTIVEDFDIYEWWVLEETGELIARFEWPRNEPIELIKNGYMYTRETEEETGLQQILRYGVDLEDV